MKDLLYKCSRNTGCDEKTVEDVVTCFLSTVANRLSEECAVDPGDNFGTFIKSHSVDCCPPSLGLLESLQIQVGCMYLSDLHTPSNLPLVQSALRKIVPDSYGLREWNDAVCYITGQDSDFDNQQDAAKYLMNWNR